MNALPDEFPTHSDGTKSNTNTVMMSEMSQDWGERNPGERGERTLVFVFDKLKLTVC